MICPRSGDFRVDDRERLIAESNIGEMMMRWTQESLLKARGITIAVIGVLILIAYLISRF